MFIQRVGDSPVNQRGGQSSRLLLAKGQFGSSRLAITWVEGAPGSEQQVHSHTESEQVYVIVQGRGSMRVDEKRQTVEKGDLIFIPPGTGHAIRNTGHEPLVYVSATAPPFDTEALEWPFRYSRKT